MIRWVPFDQIGIRHLAAVAASLLAAPPDVRLDKADLIDRLQTGELRMFEWDKGLIVVHQEEQRLVLDATSTRIWERRELAKALKRLAADWLCDTVQTTVFDRRIADAIVGVGGQIESYDVILRVGTGDEQQEEN